MIIKVKEIRVGSLRKDPLYHRSIIILKLAAIIVVLVFRKEKEVLLKIVWVLVVE